MGLEARMVRYFRPHNTRLCWQANTVSLFCLARDNRDNVAGTVDAWSIQSVKVCAWC